jgi:hypothetical protein
MMETVGTSETSGNFYETTWLSSPEVYQYHFKSISSLENTECKDIKTVTLLALLHACET